MVSKARIRWSGVRVRAIWSRKSQDSVRRVEDADVDTRSFTATSGESVNIKVDSEAIASNLDAVLRIFDSSGSELHRIDDTHGLDPEFDFTAPGGGIQVYYVGVSSAPDNLGKHDPAYNPADFNTAPLYTATTLDDRLVGRFLRSPSGELLSERVGDYRISISFDTESVTFDSAVDKHSVIYDNFIAFLHCIHFGMEINK